MAADSFLFDLATDVLNALTNHWASVNVDPYFALPERSYVSDGEPAWDCEQVTVWVERTYPSDGSGAEAAITMGPLVQRGAELQIQIARCAPVMTDDGTPPDPNEIQTSALRVLADAEMIPQALTAAYRDGDLSGCHGVVFLGWQRIGPEGGLAGGTASVQIALA